MRGIGWHNPPMLKKAIFYAIFILSRFFSSICIFNPSFHEFRSSSWLVSFKKMIEHAISSQLKNCGEFHGILSTFV